MEGATANRKLAITPREVPMAGGNRQYDQTEEARRLFARGQRTESCAEFRHADVESFMKHAKARRCPQCLALFPVAWQRAARSGFSPEPAKAAETPVALGAPCASALNDRKLHRSLVNEYLLIPQLQRPMVGSNEWFSWLDEFRERHPVEVAHLNQPLGMLARQVLWNRSNPQ